MNHMSGDDIQVYHEWISEVWRAMTHDERVRIIQSRIELGRRLLEKRSASQKQAYAEYLQSDHWQQVRRLALIAAGERCQLCNSPNRLVVHHRIYRGWYREQPGDLTVLCHPCHEMFEAHKLAKAGAA